jgi:hypothetical protein
MSVERDIRCHPGRSFGSGMTRGRGGRAAAQWSSRQYPDPGSVVELVVPRGSPDVAVTARNQTRICVFRRRQTALYVWMRRATVIGPLMLRAEEVAV